ncbi:MBL fold metallo-hydrolase [Nesterenkonia muleiensis]|uniref:MBL fold metallo-hydrolase n=1 Tax=Nesterenkonia muleiensis TaxID=2282648 RepID=UPI00192E4300|nr:MBL fold metallo-hydrolase [Nesterenkonia muleiensis]
MTGNFDVQWIHGARSKNDDADPPIQVHRYDHDTYILRQSMTLSHEAPFLYLLFGQDRAVLFDTGATEDPETFPLRATVDQIMDSWGEGNPRESYELIVAHTHSHGDHIAGDDQFDQRPLTRVVGTELEAVQSFFGFTEWPHEVVAFDLGGRVLEVTGIPGHHPTSLAVFDPATGFLLTGDSVYPGRLYAFDMPAFTASLDHLVDFAEARPVTHVMGCHIEMSRQPGRDYPVGAKYQPEEPPLQMSMPQLREVRTAARATAAKPGVYPHADFIIVSGMGLKNILRLLIRSAVQRLGIR